MLVLLGGLAAAVWWHGPPPRSAWRAPVMARDEFQATTYLPLPLGRRWSYTGNPSAAVQRLALVVGRRHTGGGLPRCTEIWKLQGRRVVQTLYWSTDANVGLLWYGQDDYDDDGRLIGRLRFEPAICIPNGLGPGDVVLEQGEQTGWQRSWPSPTVRHYYRTIELLRAELWPAQNPQRRALIVRMRGTGGAIDPDIWIGWFAEGLGLVRMGSSADQELRLTGWGNDRLARWTGWLSR